jgi:NitT/TauT family transport system permease protein
MYKHIEKLEIAGFILPVTLFTVWYVATMEGVVPAYLLPSPWDLVRTAIDFAIASEDLTPYSGKLFVHSIASIGRVVTGFGLAAAIGLPLGFLSGRIALAKSSLDPTVHLIRIVPGIGWLPLAMVWFGVGESTTLFLISLASFFPIYVNAAQGASSVSPMLVRAGRMLGASELRIFTTVIIPAAMPSTVAGLRLGLGLSWAYLVLGELTGVTHGLGAVMMDARMLGNVEMILVSMIFIGLFGRISDLLLLGSFRRLNLLKGVMMDEKSKNISK